MNKTLTVQKELFEPTLDHVLGMLHKIKSDLMEMEEPLKLQNSDIHEVTETLNDIREIISAFDQPDLFTNPAFESSDDFEQLEELIGSEKAHKIVEVFAGSNIYIPKSILTTKAYQSIRSEYKAGSSYRDLSIKYGYSETHIRNIIHKKKA
jgi:hypothetical protein